MLVHVTVHVNFEVVYIYVYLINGLTELNVNTSSVRSTSIAVALSVETFR